MYRDYWVVFGTPSYVLCCSNPGLSGIELGFNPKQSGSKSPDCYTAHVLELRFLYL